MKPTGCRIYSQCISSILFITSTCFGRLQVHHQEEQLYLCDTWQGITKYTENILCSWFHIQDYCGTSLPIFQWGDNQLRSKDALTHNVDTLWLVEDCDCMKLYINIHSSLMYKGVTIIFSSPNIQTISQLQLSENRDLLFMILTLKTASQLCDLNSGYSLHFHIFNTGRHCSDM